MTIAEAKQQCEGRTYVDIWSGHKQCSNRGKVERDGKKYCGRCDPVAKKQKRTEREAKWQAEWDAEKKAASDAKRRQAATEAILQIAHDYRSTLKHVTTVNGDSRNIDALLDELKATGWKPEGEGSE